LFLALRQAAKKWTMPIHHWREALTHFTILWPRNLHSADPSTATGDGRKTLGFEGK
jgi:hypothetical protein